MHDPTEIGSYAHFHGPEPSAASGPLWLRILGYVLDGLQVVGGVLMLPVAPGWGAFLIYRGAEGIIANATGNERGTAQFVRAVGGDDAAVLGEVGLMILDFRAMTQGALRAAERTASRAVRRVVAEGEEAVAAVQGAGQSVQAGRGANQPLQAQERAIAQVAQGGAAAEQQAVAAVNEALQAAATPWRRSLRVVFDRSCFVAGTPLLTPDGHKRIEEFQPGDVVLARSEHDVEGPLEAKSVEEVFVRVAPLWELRVRGRLIRTTAEHPFYVRNRGWVPAKELEAGGEFASHDGQWVVLEEVTDTREVATVYNLRVADYHTYFVGSPDWGFSVWAHNTDTCVRILDTGVPGPARHVLVDARGRRILHDGQSITGATFQEAAGKAMRRLNISADELMAGDLLLRLSLPASDGNSRILGRNLRRTGRPKPGKGYQASHLVPTENQTNRSMEVQRAIRDAREALESAGIGMNDARNGFWATGGQLGTHNDRYFLELGEVMRTARARGGNAVETALNDLRVRVEAGEFVPH
jgi:hypothetical protein